MYTIIGGDGKQYGPISEADLRKWIAEGRLNAQSMAKGAGDAEFRPLSMFPELSDLFGAHIPTSDVPPEMSPADWSNRDYELDIGGCVSRGWNLLMKNFGQLFLPVLIYFLIEIGIGIFGKIPILGILFKIGNIFITGQLMAGVLYVSILTIRGQPAELGKMFEGFRRGYWQLFLGYLVPALFGLLCMLPAIVYWMIKMRPLMGQFQNLNNPADMQNAMPEMMHQFEPVFLSSLPILIICLIPATYLSVNWKFTLPLIIDRQMDFWTAMKTSWKMVHKHWWTVFGLLIVVGLINIVGVLLCCVGILFTVPIGFAALMSAYETIFSESRAT